MSGKDYEKIYHNNLKSLQFDNCGNLQSNFNLERYKQGFDKAPKIIDLYTQSTCVESLHLSNTQLNQKDAALLALALDETIQKPKSKIKILDLSKNQFGKEGAKIFFEVLSKNSILQVLDISNNKIGVRGAQVLAQHLQNNQSIRFLNLFNNLIGFDGAKAIGQMLKANKTIQQIELGHNRIRDKGLLEIAEGIVAQGSKTQIRSLGLRLNFLSEDGIIDFLNKVKTNKNANTLQEIFIKNNIINEFALTQIKKVYDEQNCKLAVDIFDKLKYLEPEKLERTIWVFPPFGSASDIKQFFEEVQVCGIVLDVRLRKGFTWPNKK